MLLMNESMCTAYHEKMHEVSTRGSFFQFTDWRDSRDLRPLSQIVLRMLKKNPKISRKQLWLSIVQEHFMKYLVKELKKVVRSLQSEGVIDFVDVHGTRQINDASLLFLKASN